VDEIDEAIGQWAVERTVDEALAMLDAAAVPAGRIYTVADIAADPHYHARDMLQQVRMDDGSTWQFRGRTQPRLRRRTSPQCAALGQTRTRSCGAGPHPEQIEGLKRRGVVA
jgi:formyl-CoA transferase